MNLGKAIVELLGIAFLLILAANFIRGIFGFIRWGIVSLFKLDS